MELLQKEKALFIERTKGISLLALSLRNKEDYFKGMVKAFDDAFNQYARREKKTYKEDLNRLMAPVIERLFSYFNSPEDSFRACFEECIELSKKILNNNCYGISQKFINMSFKYLYCYGDSAEFEEKFAECHMPLDRLTMKWVKTLGDKDINRRLTAVNHAWAKIEKDLYADIQALITKTLYPGYQYKISFNQKTDTMCLLPRNKLYAEFIIWHQEAVNELYRTVKKAEPDFERLGIQWI